MQIGTINGKKISPPLPGVELVNVETPTDGEERMFRNAADGKLYTMDSTRAIALIDEADSITLKTSFVFKPGGVAVGNIYTDFAALYAAMNVPGIGPRTLFFDDTIVSPCVIPAGAYDLTGVLLTSQCRNEGSTVQVNDGVTFTGFQTCSNIYFEFLNTTTVETISDQREILLTNANINSLGTVAPFVINVNFASILLFDLGSIYDTNAPVFHINDGFTFGVDMYPASEVFSNSFEGSAAANLLVNVWAASAVFQTQTGFLGTIEFYPNDNASIVLYVPSTLANWSGIAPTSVSNALDRIASKITPIP